MACLRSSTTGLPPGFALRHRFWQAWVLIQFQGLKLDWLCKRQTPSPLFPLPNPCRDTMAWWCVPLSFLFPGLVAKSRSRARPQWVRLWWHRKELMPGPSSRSPAGQQKDSLGGEPQLAICQLHAAGTARRPSLQHWPLYRGVGGVPEDRPTSSQHFLALDNQVGK